ncbi:MAG: class I SAM-dependent methyltransferase, partial [Gaiellaceae bacterium]
GLDMLEAGCGFGFGLIWCAFRGGRAYGIDIYEPMIRTIEAFRSFLPAEWDEKITAMVGDVARMPFDSNSFDVVAAVQTISHYNDIEAFARETHRVLREGGVLVVTDSNNALCPHHRWRQQNAYRRIELGPVRSDDAAGVLSKPFIEKRSELIRENFAFDPATLTALAERTSGMTNAQVVAACEQYVDAKELPNSRFRRSRVPIDPETGMAIERLINPYAFARDLRDVGFARTRVEGYWGGASGRPYLRAANGFLAKLSPLVIWTTPSFRVAAWR